jgi:GNAT superfamily N-acetyltransferase
MTVADEPKDPRSVMKTTNTVGEAGAAMDAIVIRDVRADDFDAWRVLWDGYNAFYGRAGATALAEEITRSTWNRFLDPREPMHALVAERDGDLLGLAHIVLHRSTTMISPTCYLQDLFTAPEARGQGVAQRLIDAVYRRAELDGVGRVYWHTHESNAIAMRLYDRVGERPGFVMYRKSL